jgi:hypothetical protein
MRLIGSAPVCVEGVYVGCWCFVWRHCWYVLCVFAFVFRALFGVAMLFQPFESYVYACGSAFMWFDWVKRIDIVTFRIVCFLLAHGDAEGWTSSRLLDGVTWNNCVVP